MLKTEFEGLVGRTLSDECYDIVETVYTFHPCISETKGKEQIGKLYQMGGMRLMRDMYPVAEVARKLEDKIRDGQRIVQDARDMLSRLATGEDLRNIIGDIDCKEVKF